MVSSLTALAEELSSIPNTHIVAHKLKFQEIRSPLMNSAGTRDPHGAHK